LVLHSQIIIPIYAAALPTTRKYSIHSPNIPNSTTPYLLLLLLLLLLLMLLMLFRNTSRNRSRSIRRFSRTTASTTHTPKRRKVFLLDSKLGRRLRIVSSYVTVSPETIVTVPVWILRRIRITVWSLTSTT
jgi:hypothetical protein